MDWEDKDRGKSVGLTVVSDSLQPINCSLPGSSVHGILPARILEWVAIPFSRGSSWPRNETQISGIAANSLLSEAQGKASDSGKWT